MTTHDLAGTRETGPSSASNQGQVECEHACQAPDAAEAFFQCALQRHSDSLRFACLPREKRLDLRQGLAARAA